MASRVILLQRPGSLFLPPGEDAGGRPGPEGTGGVIVNVSSIEALVPLRDDLIPYSLSKAGIVTLTRTLAHAYGSQGFRVNVLLPGAIRTPGTERRRQGRRAAF